MSIAGNREPIAEALRSIRAHSGESLFELSRESALLVVFLRHGGCPFCRETLDRLKSQREEVEQAGVRPALVHMMSEEQAAQLFKNYGLDDLPRVSDPGQALFKALALHRGTTLDVMGPKVWWAGFKSVLLRGHRPGRPAGDVFQLGGAFLIRNGETIAAHRNRTSYEQPDFAALATATPLPPGEGQL
jgi:hypothetical protein